MTKTVIAGITAATTLALLDGFTRFSPDVVQARRVELVDTAGQVQATFSADTAGIVLTLVDGRGRPRASLRLNGEPRVSVLGGSGREVAGLGAPRAHQLQE